MSYGYSLPPENSIEVERADTEAQIFMTNSALHIVKEEISMTGRIEFARSFAKTILAFEVGSPEVDVVTHCILCPTRRWHPLLPKGYTIEDQGSGPKNSRLANSKFITKNRCLAPRYSRDVSETLAIIDFPYMLTRNYFKTDESDDAETYTRAHAVGGPMELSACTEALAMLCLLLMARADYWEQLS